MVVTVVTALAWYTLQYLEAAVHERLKVVGSYISGIRDGTG